MPQHNTQLKVAILIVAAGRGSRLGLNTPKQYVTLSGQMVLTHTLEAFIQYQVDHPEHNISIKSVIHQDDITLYQEAINDVSDQSGLLPPSIGGATRQISVLNGLNDLNEEAPDIVLIHDAARPFICGDLITNLIATCQSEGAALPTLAVLDTLKYAPADKNTRNETVVNTSKVTGKIKGSVERSHYYRAQTPQAFNYPVIHQAHLKYQDQAVTDDASLLELENIAVAMIEGYDDNFKITTPADLEKAKAMLNKTLPIDIRTGQGFDVHQFEDGNEVILCGISIPHTAKLKGHSDADVALHALTDALLGAIGEGDIGLHFPPSDEKWSGASSDQFVQHACHLIEKKGGQITHVDLTLICEAPKVGHYREKMRQSVANIMQLEVDRVNIKATTTEKLGFTGRKEGIAAQAIATIIL